MDKLSERTPYDVWFNISRFIPRNVLSTLYGVNRSFFEIATNARYEVVTFFKFDKNTKWLCRNLSDPNIGRGVLTRHVKIEPWVVQPRLKPSHKRGRSVWNFINGVFDPHYTQRTTNQWVKKRLHKDIKRVTDTISGMRNLSEYSLGWKEDRPYHPELYRAFLGPLLTRIHDRLVRLSLNIPPDMMCSLAPISLPRLEHLEIGICTKKLTEGEIDQIFDCFVVFINNLLHTLESLSISSRVPSQSLDLTRLFTMLTVFPRLQRFSLSIPFDGTHLSSPPSLVAFLNKHRRTLRHLQLSSSRCSTADSPADPEAKYWIRNVLRSLETPYPRLHGLNLALRPLKADLTPMLSFIAQHSGELDDLTLTERALTYTEVEDCLDNIGAYEHSSRLKHLRLKVQHLSPALLELLASRIPRLSLLELTFGEIVATAAHPGHSGYPAHTKRDELALFKAEIRMNRQVYASWRLGTIGIRNESRFPPLSDLSRFFTEVIPALQSIVDLADTRV
ncbi:hypothetical protein D9615_005566 [Tricholomella constricta]|uniref:F-box domain-containing protein n=1 Tax=Tricholomella constricta TaxID=117010 RepID=A0A8H5HEC7_9AGAR|nr:hypothetical protein D9615_005566 [Tricholomella constricta]